MGTERAETDSIPEQKQPWPGRTDDLAPVPDHGERSYTGRDRLLGKRALVTGGDSGIGRAVAIAFAREGATVAISYLPEEQHDAEQTREQVERSGGTCSLLPTDLRTQRNARDLVADAVTALGGLDVLVSNAAYQMAQTEGLAALSAEQLERTFATNVFATVWLAQAALPHLQPGASILITTSIQAYEPSVPLLDYASTKSALNNLTVNLAGELGPRGIRVNAVAPGAIWTPLIPATMPPQKVQGFGADSPLGRAAHPVEVATAYVYLASAEASYVSGTVLGVTGGRPVF